jgi:peptidoglycan hydrolase-like protein with peptidoglycan-binding domain
MGIDFQPGTDGLGRPHTDGNGYTPIDRNTLRKLPNRGAVARALAKNLPAVPLRDRDGVKFLQQVLVELGLMDAKAIRFAAGNYGQRTTAAVSEIQASLGRRPDGNYDEAVRVHLLELLGKVRDAPSHGASAGCSLLAALRGTAKTPAALAEAPTDCVATLNYTDLATSQPVPQQMLIRDARPLQEQGQLSLDSNGFSLTQQETLLCPDDFYFNRGLVQTVYYAETEELIKRELGADRVFVLAHQVRNSGRAAGVGTDLNAFAEGSNVASYASVIHTDFTGSKSAEKFYRAAGIPEGVKVRFVLLNTWRNISENDPVYNNALACCDASSISSDELVRVDELLKPGAACQDYDGSVQAHRECAEQYRLTAEHAERHQWYYFPHMKKDEVLMFKQFDSDPTQTSRFTFHSSFVDGNVRADLPPRESIETRVMAIFIDEEPTVKRAVLPKMVLEREPLFTLQSRLAARSSRGLLDPKEVEKIADRAALENTRDDDVLRRLSREVQQQGGSNTVGVPMHRLYSGCRGEPVLQLQLVLIELGIMDAYPIKRGAGMFGDETTAAVKHIQKYLRLPSDGVYDDAIRAQLLKMLYERAA